MVSTSIYSIESEEELRNTLGIANENEEDDESNDFAPDSPIQINVDESVDVTDVQGLENVPIVVQPTDDSTEVLYNGNDNGNDVDVNNSSMQGCVSCSEVLDGNSGSACEKCEHLCYVARLSLYENRLVCSLCMRQEVMNIERRGTKRRQEEQAQIMLRRSAKKFKEATVGHSFRCCAAA